MDIKFLSRHLLPCSFAFKNPESVFGYFVYFCGERVIV